MADGVTFQATPATPILGTVISTEDVTTLNGGAVSSQHVQRTGLAIITANGTAIDLPGDAANGLDVDVTRVSGNVTVTNGGTFAVQVDGAGLTALQLIDDVVYVDDADWTDGASKHALVGGLYQSVPQSITDGDVGPIQLTENGFVIVSVNGVAEVAGAAIVGEFAGGEFNGLRALMIGAVAKATAPSNASDLDAVWPWALLNGSLVVNVASGGTLITGDASGLDVDITLAIADDAAFTVGTSKVVPSGFVADESSTDSVDEGDIGAARMTPDRKQIVTDLPHTAGGLAAHKTVSAASTNATSVKASAGQLYEIYCSNVNAAARYLKLYDKASAPTVGTDTPVWTLIIPGNTAGGGFAKSIPKGLAFASGIAFALTTEATDAGTTGVAANELVVNLGYK